MTNLALSNFQFACREAYLDGPVIVLGVDQISGAPFLGTSKLALVHVNADDAPCASLPQRIHHCQPNGSQPKYSRCGPLLDLSYTRSQLQLVRLMDTARHDEPHIDLHMHAM